MSRLKRNRKSIYIDLYTGRVDQASKFSHYPAARPHRFLFVGYYTKIPSLKTSKFQKFLERNGIKMEVYKEKRQSIYNSNEENYF